MADPLGAGMRFAESQLRRHGWKRGRGLGKREDGIARPIRVSMKCGTAGVGHGAAEQLSFHWWERVFNEAAANVTVRDGQDEVSVEMLSEQRFGVSTKKPHKVPPPTGSALYGRFVKAATLTARGEEPTKQQVGSESREEEEEKLDHSSARRLTDEELVQVCGGRTAHKGARHGLTMSAKLARLEQQEHAFLAAMQHRGGGQPESPHGSATAEKEKKKKKKSKWSVDGADVEELQSQEQSRGQEEVGERRVGKRKKKKRKKDEVANTEVLPEDTSVPGGAEYSLGERRKKKAEGGRMNGPSCGVLGAQRGSGHTWV